MPINREDCWGVSWNCGMKCAVIHAHSELIFLPPVWEGTEGEEGSWIDEKVRLFNQCRCCTGTNTPCPFTRLLVACSSQRQGKSSTSTPCVFLGMALPLAVGNPFATGTGIQEVQVSCCSGALQSPRGSQQCPFEFRRSPSCPVRYEWLRVIKKMIARDREERADSRQSV